MLRYGRAEVWDALNASTASQWAKAVYPVQSLLPIGKIAQQCLYGLSGAAVVLVDTFAGRVIATDDTGLSDELRGLIPTGVVLTEAGGNWTDFNAYSGRDVSMVRDDDLGTSWASASTMSSGSDSSWLAVDFGEDVEIVEAGVHCASGLEVRVEGLGIFAAGQADFSDESEVGYFSGAQYGEICSATFTSTARYFRFHPGVNWNQTEYMDVAELKMFKGISGGGPLPSVCFPSPGQVGAFQWEIESEDGYNPFATGKLSEICLPQLSKRTLPLFLDKGLSLSTGYPFALIDQSAGKVYFWEPQNSQELSASIANLSPVSPTIAVQVVRAPIPELIFEGGQT